MDLKLDLQNPYEIKTLPKEALISSWVLSVLEELDYQKKVCELTIRVVNNKESQMLNQTYRNKDKPTNVLSFPFELPDGFDLVDIELDNYLLGDLVICHEVLVKEAAEQNKEIKYHWAHMIIHGVLHLLGFDHINESEAKKMEDLEIKILAKNKISNPYIM